MDGVEIWRPVVGFEGLYEVSNQGRVRSLGRVLTRSRFGKPHIYAVPSKIMTQTVGSTSKSPVGYLKVTLTPLEGEGTGRGRQKLVHHLVLTAFRGPRPAKQEGAHCNGEHFDNRLTNLEWKTTKANSDDAFKHGVRVQKKGRFQMTYT